MEIHVDKWFLTTKIIIFFFALRSGACIVQDKTTYSNELVNMARFHMPEKYKTFMIQRMNFWPLYEVATCHLENTCQTIFIFPLLNKNL